MRGGERVAASAREAGRRMREWAEDRDLYPSDNAGREREVGANPYDARRERDLGRDYSDGASRRNDASFEQDVMPRRSNRAVRHDRGADYWAGAQNREVGYGFGPRYGDERDTYGVGSQFQRGGYNDEDHGIPQREQPYGWASRQDVGGQSGARPVRVRRGGEHYGKGPRGYERSEARVLEEVCEVLARDPDIDASDVSVTIDNREVTLEGTIENRRMKHDAENLIEEIQGVVDVHNHLKVRRGFWGEVKDRLQGRDDDGDHSDHTGEGVKSARRAV